MKGPADDGGSVACPDNPAVAQLLRELAVRLEMDGVPHRPRAYRRAAETIERLDLPIAEIHEQSGMAGLDEISGVGPHIARLLCELLETGRISRLERLRRATPVDVMGLLAVHGIGPRRLQTLWHDLRVTSVEDLEQAVEHKSVQGLPGFGVRTEESLRQVLRLRGRSGKRMPLSKASRIADALRNDLDAHSKVSRCTVAGSIRRGRPTVGDIDLVAASADAAAVAESFLARSDIAGVYTRGPHRVSVALESGIDVDLRIVPPECFGSALLYFTGSREHTLAMRRLALAQGLRLNEYGLYRGQRRIAGKTEEEVYAALALPYVAPEERRGGGEIRRALRHGAPSA